MMNMHKLKVFSGRANRPLAQAIASNLGDSLGKLHISDFPDGETKVAIEEDVRGRDIFVVQPTCPPVNQNLMELLVVLDAFKRSSAQRVTAVIPYYGYARQDRKDQGRVLITIPGGDGNEPVQVPAEVRHWHALSENVLEVGCRFDATGSASEMHSPVAGLVERIEEAQKPLSERRLAMPSATRTRPRWRSVCRSVTT